MFICCLKGSKPKTYKKIKKEKTISHLWEDFSQASSEESYAKKADKMVLVLLPHSIHTSLHYDPEAASGGGVHSPVTQIWAHPLTKRMWQTWPKASSQSRPRQALYASSFSSQKFAEPRLACWLVRETWWWVSHPSKCKGPENHRWLTNVTNNHESRLKINKKWD